MSDEHAKAVEDLLVLETDILDDDNEKEEQLSTPSADRVNRANSEHKTNIEIISVGSSVSNSPTETNVCSATRSASSAVVVDEEDTEGGSSVVSLTSLRRGGQLLPVTPGAVPVYPTGVVSPMFDNNNNEEQQQQEREQQNGEILTRRSAPSSTRHHQLRIPEATTVREAPLVYAVIDQTIDQEMHDNDTVTPKRCLWRNVMLVPIVIAAGVVVAVAVVMISNGKSPTSKSALTTALTPSFSPSSTVSLVPSLAPSDSFETRLVELIQSHSPGTIFSSSDVASAVNWMLNDPYSLALENDDKLVQRFALVTVWFAFDLDSLSGLWALLFRDWMQPTDECTWKGNAVDEISECNSDGIVNELSFPFPYVTGGSIPVEITLLSHLTVLGMNGNMMAGSIPSQLSFLTSLTKLQLGSHTNETIPSNLWSSLTNLEEFSIGYSPEMSATTFPTNLSSLTKLASLVLHGVQLTGSIPTELALLTSLTLLSLGENPSLTGGLPTHIGMLSQLTYLDLSICELTGPIPTELGLLDSLVSLQLGHNAFEDSTIPAEIGLLTHLTWLDISYSHFNGSFPSNIGQLQKLGVLHLGWNRLLEGNIPSQIYGMSKLTSLSFGGGGLGSMMSASPIMTEIGYLTDLVSLDLAGCNLTGSIPTEISLLTGLVDLSLGTNELTGAIPTELGLLRRLTHLGLPGNNLRGIIPSELSWLSDLKALDLYGNHDLVGTSHD